MCTEPSSVSHAQVQSLARRWGSSVPLVRDLEAFGRDVFRIPLRDLGGVGRAASSSFSRSARIPIWRPSCRTGSACWPPARIWRPADSPSSASSRRCIRRSWPSRPVRSRKTPAPREVNCGKHLSADNFIGRNSFPPSRRRNWAGTGRWTSLIGQMLLIPTLEIRRYHRRNRRRDI